MSPFATLAEQIAAAAGSEARQVASMIHLSRKFGLTDAGTAIAIDDARERYDLLAETHQILLALAPYEAVLRLFMKETANVERGTRRHVAAMLGSGDDVRRDCA